MCVWFSSQEGLLLCFTLHLTQTWKDLDCSGVLQNPPFTSHAMRVLVSLNDSCLGKWPLKDYSAGGEVKVLETYPMEAWRTRNTWKGPEHREEGQKLGVSIRWLPLRTELGVVAECYHWGWLVPLLKSLPILGTGPRASRAKWYGEVGMRSSQLTDSGQMGKLPFSQKTLQIREMLVLEKLKGAWGWVIEVCREAEWRNLMK